MSQGDLAVSLGALFRGLGRAYGVYQLLSRPNGGKKIEGKARTLRGEVTPALWAAHLDGSQGLGIVPIDDEATSYFGAIDIDRYDLDLIEIERKVSKQGLALPLIPCRTKSGGVHLYCFFPQGAPAALVRQKLNEWSVALGHGGCEIFPKQDALSSEDDVGNWINMPYFGAQTEKGSNRYAIINGKKATLEEFIARAQAMGVTTQQLESIKIDIESGGDFEQGPPCLQTLGRQGFQQGSRSNGLFAIGVYLRKRYPDDWEERLGQYNQQYMKPPMGAPDVKSTIKSLKRKSYSYKCDEQPCKNFCNRQLCVTREFGIGRGIEDWGIVIDSDVLKIMTDPPFYILTINGVRMQLHPDDLMQQLRFRQACMERLNYLPPPLRADKWTAQINQLLTNRTEVDAPADASPTGELAAYLELFCTDMPQAETREEVLVGKPFTEDGWTMFRAADFKKFLASRHFLTFQGTRLFAQLRNLGVEDRRLSISNNMVFVWAVKAYAKADIKVPPKRVTGLEGEM